MNQTVLGVAMIAGGLLLTLGGVTLLVRKEPEPNGIEETTGSLQPPASVRPGQEAKPTPEEKGEAFEKWVVTKFNRDYFSLKDWRGDKFVDGRFAESSQHPDLEVEFKLREVRAPFAVECKWRRSFEQRDKPGITWASERQIANYQKFSADKRMPVFVVIGIGGEPDAPSELYVAPLDKLRYPWANAEYLARFRRANVSTDFYYDHKKSELR